MARGRFSKVDGTWQLMVERLNAKISSSFHDVTYRVEEKEKGEKGVYNKRRPEKTKMQQQANPAERHLLLFLCVPQ